MKNEKIKEVLNHLAYNDVCECSPPSMPDDELYMQFYNFWRPLQKYPYEDYEAY